MKVLYLTNVPAPYRVDFFNKLGEQCELTVLFEKKTSSERDESWKKYRFTNFTGVFLNGISIKSDAAFCPSVIKYIRSITSDILIITNISSPTGIIAMSYCIRKTRAYYIEADGGFPKKGKKSIKEFLKKYFISHSKGCFSTGLQLDSYFEYYGCNKTRIYRYRFSSVHETEVLKHIPTSSDRLEKRKRLEITEKTIVSTVGQFIHRKGFDILIKAAALVSSDIGFYIIGGKPTEEYLKYVAEYKLRNVHFVNYLEKKPLFSFLEASDFFVFPTREDIWGLVVNEAGRCGLPVISTVRCGAALELIRDRENGFIVQVEDVVSLADKIKLFAQNPEYLEKCKLEALKTARSYTIETMAQDHLEHFRRLLESK